MVIDENASVAVRGRRRLTQRGPAVALALILLLVPGLPMLADALLTSPSDDPTAEGPVMLESVEGQAITVVAPILWRVHDRGSSARLQSGDAVVSIEVYDRGGRDVEPVAERLLRKGRLVGISAAPDGGRVATGDGALTGRSCVLTTAVATGTCAVVSDDDVVVLVQSLGTPASPALPLDQVLGFVSKGRR